MPNQIQLRKSEKKTKIFYRIFTGLFAFLMLGSAIPDIFSVQDAVEGFHKIGMPAYLLPFLGIAKTLGVVAILIPGYPRIKEWAYAGLSFDLIGATYSIIASGQPAGNWIFMALPLVMAAASYTWYHKKMKVTPARQKSQVTIQQNAYQKDTTADAITA